MRIRGSRRRWERWEDWRGSAARDGGGYIPALLRERAEASMREPGSLRMAPTVLLMVVQPGAERARRARARVLRMRRFMRGARRGEIRGGEDIRAGGGMSILVRIGCGEDAVG